MIFFFPNHSVFLADLDEEYAYILDNNRIDNYVLVSIEEFIPRWRTYGGVAITPMPGEPAPPIPWLAANSE